LSRRSPAEGPYNLWRAGETSRRVKDLAGAFAQLPHLPKMLKASAILETLATGVKRVRLSCGSLGGQDVSNLVMSRRMKTHQRSALELVLPKQPK